MQGKHNHAETLGSQNHRQIQQHGLENGGKPQNLRGN
jgi:hypothetical protein